MDENNNNGIIVEEEKNNGEATPKVIEGAKNAIDTEQLPLFKPEEKKPKIMNTSATFNEVTGKWEGYVPKKGTTPPWDPWNPAKRKNRVTLKERKFMMMLSTTGSMQEAYRGVYKVKDYGNPRLEAARVSALANQVLRRIRVKAPDLVAAMTFEDITPDFVKKEMLKLYNDSGSSIHEKTRLLELMGKTQAMFTDKIQTETKVREIVDTIYKESDEDFPEQDHRLGRLEMEELKIGKA